MSVRSANGLPAAFSLQRVLECVDDEIVGLRREAEVLAAALAAGRHVVLEGPPGTGKSTLLRSVAEAVGWGVALVEGNAELTPARLIGWHDPALVLEKGYRQDAFIEGPLYSAMRHGSLLYIEEMNRVPEETLNVLMTALAEREIHVPRVGRLCADERFRLVAAMNPFDAIGTARVAQALYDRVCRVAVGYQDEWGERRIVDRLTRGEPATIELAVALGRATRNHPEIQMGSSVRGAIDMVLLAGELSILRSSQDGGGTARATLLDAALAAFSGRIRLDDGCEDSPEAVVTAIFESVATTADPPRGEDVDPGKGSSPSAPPPGQQGSGRMLEGQDAQQFIRDAGRRSISRSELAAAHELGRLSPAVGEFDAKAFEQLLEEDADAALAALCDLASATDRALRAEARRLAGRVFFRMVTSSVPRARGMRRLAPVAGGTVGDLDLDRTLERTEGRRPRQLDDIVARCWSAAHRPLCLLIDRSGSMRGEGVATAAMAAAGIVVAAGERADFSVVAFAHDAVVVKRQGERRPPEQVIDDILSLRGRGTTDVALALRTASAQLRRSTGPQAVTVLLSDCLVTTGGDPLQALSGLGQLQVLGTSVQEQSIGAGRELARRTGGRHVIVRHPGEVVKAMASLLA